MAEMTEEQAKDIVGDYLAAVLSEFKKHELIGMILEPMFADVQGKPFQSELDDIIESYEDDPEWFVNRPELVEAVMVLRRK